MASRWLPRAVLSTAAAAGLVLTGVTIALFASPGVASATATATIALHQGHEGLAKDFDPHNVCGEQFANLDPDQDGWHFVLDGTNDFLEVRLVFGTGSGNVNVTVNKTLAQGGSSGPGWFGYLDD